MFFAGDVGHDYEHSTQIIMSVVLLILGYWYYRLREVASKVLLGILAIVAGVVTNWFELGKVLNNNADRYERAIFVAAALAVIAHGFKQLKQAADGKDTD
jgi:hypothetical protein